MLFRNTWNHVTVQTNDYLIGIVTWIHMIMDELLVIDKNPWNHNSMQIICIR